MTMKMMMTNLPSDTSEDGPWFVWGDGMQPILEDVSYGIMKAKVDELAAAGRKDVYGENNDNSDIYPKDENAN